MIDIALVFLLLTLNIFCGVSIVDFEQANSGWVNSAEILENTKHQTFIFGLALQIDCYLLLLLTHIFAVGPF